MNPKRRRLLSKDHIYRDLTVALVSILVIAPPLSHLTSWPKVDSFLTVAFLLFALYEVTRRTSDLAIGLVLGVPAVASGIFNAATPDTPTFNIAPTVFGSVFLLFLTQRILKDVFAGGRISSERIFGAICAYLLIGFVFANVYGFVALVDDHAFVVGDALRAELAEGGGHGIRNVLTYFSFVTMSTLGYGDMTPISPVARTLAWLQAVIGQLYLAVVIATLVGSHIANRSE